MRKKGGWFKASRLGSKRTKIRDAGISAANHPELRGKEKKAKE